MIVEALNTVGVHWAMVQPGSAFLRVVARFILARVSIAGSSWSIHESRDEAIAACRAALNRLS